MDVKLVKVGRSAMMRLEIDAELEKIRRGALEKWKFGRPGNFGWRAWNRNVLVVTPMQMLDEFGRRETERAASQKCNISAARSDLAQMPSGKCI